jgi:hypothetical protein
MKTPLIYVLIATVGLIVAAFVWGGRYSVAGLGAQLYVVDRFTGSVRHCTPYECKPVVEEPSEKAMDTPIQPPKFVPDAK